LKQFQTNCRKLSSFATNRSEVFPFPRIVVPIAQISGFDGRGIGNNRSSTQSHCGPQLPDDVITRLPHRRHTLLQIGWGNQRQLGSDGAADVPGLMIFKSPGASYRRGFF
jgi:hypothetical protein